MMKAIPVKEAVGSILCHDVTRIVPGEFKGRAFKKGHLITAEDVPDLLEIGKEHIYVLEMPPGIIHENEAAERIARAAAGRGLVLTDTSEGRVNIKAAYTGLLKIDVEGLFSVNYIDDIVLGTLHSGHRVDQGRAVAGARVVPLVIEEEKIRRVEEICGARYPLIEVRPFKSWRIGVITTGSEVYHGRIKDAFGPVVKKKFADLGSEVIDQVFVSDEREMTVRAIQDFLNRGAEMIVLTGGMSVDPDDQTPASIRAAGASVVTYGAPTFPGAMFMLAYIGDVPVVGLPGCVMYYKATIFDLVVPRLLAGEKVTREDIVALGHGGFCAGCAECRYPVCGFGKGALC